MIVLFVEDNTNLAEFTMKNIKAERPSWEIVLAKSCSEARRIIDQNVVSVAIVDVDLPDGSGLDLLSEFRTKNMDLSVICVSALVSAGVTADVLRRGGFGVVEKPFDIKNLVATVEQALVVEDKEGTITHIVADTPPGPIWRQSPGDEVDFHFVQNRLAALLAGIRAFDADVRSAAGNKEETNRVTDEYCDRLVEIVSEVSSLIKSASRS